MRTIDVRKSITAANDALANKLRSQFTRHGILVLNLIASPGAGKTALIEKTIARLGAAVSIKVVEGDPYTHLDSQRVIRAGAQSIQINTEGGCHLDAQMVGRAVDRFDLDQTDLLIVENVGNLLCPAAWDLGQDATVVVASLAEGADKPLKYPEAFTRAQVVVINKIDLEPHLPVTTAELRRNALTVNPELTVFEVSCLHSTGLDSWCQWVRDRIATKK
ncbi:hydrogenase nickel incorporation protein HypB [uncultured Desulfosarcina sp.]|uniref:hydrogenase nickel incorporation protein HypB n=1 Tax=uncultured Desulfosarcina sp. TaxID=218289 RepID=UPI0029C6D2D3|nr:hydrogenase nickel incorporation protein HypB [uncultured Desulfosarcina sp.]